jgi:hypothetical protein
MNKTLLPKTSRRPWEASYQSEFDIPLAADLQISKNPPSKDEERFPSDKTGQGRFLMTTAGFKPCG